MGKNRHFTTSWCKLSGIINKRIDHEERQGFVGFDMKVSIRHFEDELLLSKGILLHGNDTKDVAKREACHLKTEPSPLHLNPRSESVVNSHHARTQFLNIRKVLCAIFAHFIEFLYLSNNAVKVRNDGIDDRQLGALKDVSFLLAVDALLHHLTLFPTLFQMLFAVP